MDRKSSTALRYKKAIIAVSILIPVVVAVLFRIRLKVCNPLLFTPIYAAINGYTALILLIALWAIKQRKITLHEQLMKTHWSVFSVFGDVLIYHLTSDRPPMVVKVG